MNNEVIIYGIEHKLILQEFISFATNEFGSITMNKIIKNVNTSGKVAKFLFEASRIRVRFVPDHFLGCIHSSTNFVFSNAETISIAAIALLMKWDHNIGEPSFLSDDIYLNMMFFSILEECDKYKTHINSAPNFFERFNNHIERVVKLRVIKNSNQEVKTDISFDSVLCDAIRSEVKTEFRVNENLEGINFEPDEWILKKYDVKQGALLFSNFLGESILVKYPYELRSIIKVFDVTNSLRIHSEIMITSFRLQRMREVDQTDAMREGYSAYSERIEELFLKDPSLDAELCLFQEDWVEKYGNSAFARNEWIWVFQFEIYQDIHERNKSVATSMGLTDAQLIALVNANI
jgi:hypothetical protein